MNTKGKEFVVSVADFAFYINGVLACTGVTNLSSSISVSMQEQAVNAGLERFRRIVKDLADAQCRAGIPAFHKPAEIPEVRLHSAC